MQVHRFTVQIRRREADRVIRLDWNPLARALEPPACEFTASTHRPRLVCDDALHLVVPAALAPCATCSRTFCRACHPQHCPKCGANRRIACRAGRPELITSDRLGRADDVTQPRYTWRSGAGADTWRVKRGIRSTATAVTFSHSLLELCHQVWDFIDPSPSNFTMFETVGRGGEGACWRSSGGTG